MRRAISAVIWSLVLPGAGQVYNKQWPKALIYGGIAIVTSLICMGVAMPALSSIMDQVEPMLESGGDPTLIAEQMGGHMSRALARGFWLMITTVAYFAAAVDAGLTAVRQSRQSQQSIVGGPIA